MTDHLRRDIDGDVLLAIMYEKLEADKCREHSTGSSLRHDRCTGLLSLLHTGKGSELWAFPVRERRGQSASVLANAEILRRNIPC